MPLLGQQPEVAGMLTQFASTFPKPKAVLGKLSCGFLYVLSYTSVIVPIYVYPQSSLPIGSPAA